MLNPPVSSSASATHASSCNDGVFSLSPNKHSLSYFHGSAQDDEDIAYHAGSESSGYESSRSATSLGSVKNKGKGTRNYKSLSVSTKIANHGRQHSHDLNRGPLRVSNNILFQDEANDELKRVFREHLRREGATPFPPRSAIETPECSPIVKANFSDMSTLSSPFTLPITPSTLSPKPDTDPFVDNSPRHSPTGSHARLETESSLGGSEEYNIPKLKSRARDQNSYAQHIEDNRRRVWDIGRVLDWELEDALLRVSPQDISKLTAQELSELKALLAGEHCHYNDSPGLSRIRALLAAGHGDYSDSMSTGDAQASSTRSTDDSVAVQPPTVAVNSRKHSSTSQQSPVKQKKRPAHGFRRWFSHLHETLKHARASRKPIQAQEELPKDMGGVSMDYLDYHYPQNIGPSGRRRYYGSI